MAMQLPAALRPAIRAAHAYDFPKEPNGAELTRYGYCYAFHLMKSGKGKLAVSDQTYNVKKGDLLHIPPTVRHSFFSDPEQPLSSYNLYCELWPGAPADTRHHLAWDAAEFNPALLTPVRADPAIDGLPVYFPLQHQEPMIVLFEQIVQHHQQSRPLADAIAESLLRAFVLAFVQLSQAPLPADYRVKQAMDLIDQGANAQRNYEAWLARSGLRKTQFHDLFKKATGLSPKAYWTRAIMKQAAAALRESNRSITDLAYDMGYSSVHHFTKQFTAFHGVPPSAFRHAGKE